MVRGKDGSDPGAVLFDAVTRAKNEKIDVVLCDTAGRLHTKSNLMGELQRLERTLAKAREGSPQEVLLVVDATTGQNAIQQARQFHEALGVTGFVLTKLDGTAKGGVIIGICDELKIPVRYVGIGEKVADLKEFNPHEFVDALFAD
jgi:fused signal recognition particle receptor